MHKWHRILRDCRRHVTGGESSAHCQLIRPTSSSTLPGAPAGTRLYYSTNAWGHMMNTTSIQTHQLCLVFPKSLKTSLLCPNDLSNDVSPYKLAIHSMSDQGRNDGSVLKLRELSRCLLPSWHLIVNILNTQHRQKKHSPWETHGVSMLLNSLRNTQINIINFNSVQHSNFTCQSALS